MTAELKALLLATGSVNIDPSLLPKGRASTAGPGAGMRSVFFNSGGKRVKLSMNSSSPFSIVEAERESGRVLLRKDGKTLAVGTIEPAPAHCPKQAFVTLSEKCIFDCKYCPVPKMQGQVKTDAEVLQVIDEVYERGELQAISITSGIEESMEGEVLRVLRLLPSLKKYDVPVGVSVYPTEKCSERLKAAGVSEVKYNVESMDPEIFKLACGELSLDYVLDKLEEAVGIFGKNRVFSNFIIGLGESDECVEKGVEKLASMGVIPVLRPANPHPLRAGDFTFNRPDQQRLLKLASMEKHILLKYGLRPDLARTMCLKCTGCDLVPFVDI
ncbi:radical SAM protein [Methanosarcina sp. KYL-1]|nr:radical SAM protein [Methanosarcina sp. KYL-1]